MPGNRQRTVALLLALAAGGCAGAKPAPPPPPRVTVQLTASTQVNPDDQGRSLPTLVRVYVLRSAARLEKADYEVLYGDPRPSVGEDLLVADEVLLSPGQTVLRTFDRDAAAKAVAVVAVVRRPAGLSWRAVSELPPPAATKGPDRPLVFSVEDYRVQQLQPQR